MLCEGMLHLRETLNPVERLFSVSVRVVTVTRNRLNPETVSLLVMLKNFHNVPVDLVVGVID